MIKFFRTIRQNLLNEGKTSKYFKYAIGEIVLVVIGILIALQINNWNDSRKLKIAEKVLLHNVLENLERDSISITRITNVRERIVRIHKGLIDIVNGVKSTDDIDSLFLLRRYIPFGLITKYNHPNLSSQVLDENVKSAVLSYFSAIDLNEFLLDNYNNMLDQKLRPFLGEKKLNVYGNQFEEEELINHLRFYKELQQEELQQVLFDVGMKLRSINTFSHKWENDNEHLKKTIKAYLKKS